MDQALNALDMGICAPTIAEAVFARFMSAIKDERIGASEILHGPTAVFSGDREEFIAAIHDALYCSKICSYAQGFQLMREAQKEYGWELHFGEIARIWRGGCIIRAAFLQKITEAYERGPELANLLLDPYFKDAVERAQENWEASRGHGCETWNSDAHFLIGSGLFRWLPDGPSATQTSCRRNAITSVPIPTSGWTSQEGDSFISTGRIRRGRKLKPDPDIPQIRQVRDVVCLARQAHQFASHVLPRLILIGVAIDLLERL